MFFSESWGNKGDEVASYLRFIVDYWDTLPEYTAFVHGHDVSWHQMGYSMQYILRNLCLEHLRTRRCEHPPVSPAPVPLERRSVQRRRSNTSFLPPP